MKLTQLHKQFICNTYNNSIIEQICLTAFWLRLAIHKFFATIWRLKKISTAQNQTSRETGTFANNNNEVYMMTYAGLLDPIKSLIEFERQAKRGLIFVCTVLLQA